LEDLIFSATMPKAKNQSNFRGVFNQANESEPSRISIKGQFSVRRFVGGNSVFCFFFLKKEEMINMSWIHII